MPTDRQSSGPASALSDTDLIKAFQELAKGERTASAMETQLTSLEQKIDELLASVDVDSDNTVMEKDETRAGIKESGKGGVREEK
ncbi:hypothetical protein MMC12_002383 [Toensbergia leucococca]|nr:hypothetical protein [Toensbergia leucococca]